MTTWIVVADSHRARLFEAEHNLSRLTEFGDFVHPGRIADAKSQTPSQRQRQAKVFARELAQRLHREFLQRRFSDLTLVAPPQFLALLRRALDANVDLAVNRAIGREMTRCSVAELENYFSQL
jgi:protein required for attachment to host cells